MKPSFAPRSASRNGDDDDLQRVTMSGSTTYTVGVVDVYKANMDLPCGQNLEVKTPTSSAACGLNLELYKDYVIGMYVLDDGSLSANSCGPTVAVENLTAESIEVLENGGECIDPCANWACITQQVSSAVAASGQTLSTRLIVRVKTDST